MSLILISTLTFSTEGAILSDQSLVDGLNTVVPLHVNVQGEVREWPDEDLNRRLIFLKQILAYVANYALTVPGDHLFRWNGAKANLAPKLIHLYFTDRDYITYMPPLTPGRFQLHPHTREEELMFQDSLTGGWHLLIVVRLNKLLHIPEQGGMPHPYGEINLKSLLAGRLLGHVTQFLAGDPVKMAAAGGEEDRLWGQAARRFGVNAESTFWEWWMKQPEFELDSEGEQQYVRAMAEYTFRRRIEVNPNALPGAEGCGPVTMGEG